MNDSTYPACVFNVRTIYIATNDAIKQNKGNHQTLPTVVWCSVGQHCNIYILLSVGLCYCMPLYGYLEENHIKDYGHY